MIWLIYGADGWIGNQFFKLLNKEQNNKIIKGKARCDDVESMENEIKECNPTNIICCIGRTHGGNYNTIDYLEGGPDKLYENIRDNLFAPLMMANICVKYNIHLTYLGTGCIYSDNEEFQNNGGANEKDLPNFTGSSYSVCKGFTDRMIRIYQNNVLNLRIRMPIDNTDSSRNLINKIIKYSRVHDTPNSMSVLPELLPVAIDMAKKRITGSFNFANPGSISHPEILDMYIKYVNPDYQYEIISHKTERESLKADRSNIILDVRKLCSLYPEIKPIKESIENLFKQRIIHKPKNLLVTGGCGFIGSHFINHIIQKYPDIFVVNIDKMDYCSSEENVTNQDPSRYIFYHLDLTGDYEKISKILNEHNIDTIAHFAAQSHVSNSFGNSLDFTMDNVLGTHKLLEASRLYGKIQRFIHVSTDEVYGQVLDNKHKFEDCILNPTNPYSASKAGAEFIAKAYIKSFKMPIIITRGNNVYGPNQYPEKLIPRFIKLLKENHKMTIEGSGNQMRTFVYVSDVCEAFELIMTNGIIGDIYNIGSEEEYTVMDIAKILCKKIQGSDANIEDFIEYVEDRNFNDFRYFIGSDKLKELGWIPKTSLDEGLSKMLELQ